MGFFISTDYSKFSKMHKKFVANLWQFFFRKNCHKIWFNILIINL